MPLTLSSVPHSAQVIFGELKSQAMDVLKESVGKEKNEEMNRDVDTVDVVCPWADNRGNP